MKLIIASAIFDITVSAFVAPIPASREADSLNAVSTSTLSAISKAPRLDGKSPKLGTFQREVCWDTNNSKVSLIVSGNTYVKDGEVWVKYNYQTKTTYANSRMKSVEMLYITMKLSDLLETPPSQNAPASKSNPILANDWGSFSYYIWNRFDAFIKYPGSTRTPIDFDHPDNYYYPAYHPEEFNLDWWYTWYGWPYAIHHIASSEVIAQKNSVTLAGIVGEIVTNVGTITGVVVASIAAATIEALAALMAVIGIWAVLLWTWIDQVLQSEQDDGWAYTYVWPDLWVSISYGAWKDTWVKSYSLAGSL